MFNFKPTPYYSIYTASETPDEFKIYYRYLNHGATIVDENHWKEDITETGYTEFSKTLYKVIDPLTEEFFGYVVSGHVYHSSTTDVVAFPILKVFKEKDKAIEFYSDLTNYWMRAELEIQKEKQR